MFAKVIEGDAVPGNSGWKSGFVISRLAHAVAIQGR
jgi:hypothetical protein